MTPSLHFSHAASQALTAQAYHDASRGRSSARRRGYDEASYLIFSYGSDNGLRADIARRGRMKEMLDGAYWSKSKLAIFSFSSFSIAHRGLSPRARRGDCAAARPVKRRYQEKSKIRAFRRPVRFQFSYLLHATMPRATRGVKGFCYQNIFI